MKKLIALLSLLFIASVSADEILSEVSYVGEADGFFGGRCELHIQKIETTGIYGHREIRFNIDVISGDDKFNFLVSEAAVTSDHIGAIAGQDFFMVRPTILSIDLDENQHPVSLLITKERIGSNKLLGCSDFE